MNNSKIAFLSVLSNTTVVILKIIAGIFTGSIAIISEAIHSLLDLVASFIAFISVRISNKPADADHPYGHGKIENISGTIETLLIFVAGFWIIYECIHKFMHPEPMKIPLLGISVMLFGAVINFIVSRIIQRAATDTKSIAMKSNAFHLLTDVFTSLGVAGSLVLVQLTNWYFLDPLIGIILACFIMKEAFTLLKEAFPPLMDARLSPVEEQSIRHIIDSYKKEYLEYHDFRTRCAGAEIYVDFHLVVPSEMDVETAHDLCNRIEDDIHALCQANVLIHVEPAHERRKNQGLTFPS